MAEPGEPLTERELDIVRLLGTGAGNKQIAAQLHLSPNTVKVHLRNIFTKLEAKSRTEVTMIAVRNGWISAAGESSASPEAGAQLAPDAPANPVSEGAAEAPVSDDTPGATDAVGANALAAARVVAVAPNPQPLPRLAVWRRVAMAVAGVIAIAGILLSLPAPHSAAAPGSDGTDIVEDTNPGGELLLPGEATRWYLRDALPAPRTRSAAAVANGRVYLIGGETAQTATGDVLVFDPASNTWTPVDAPKPTPVRNAAAVAVGPLIYVAGGTTAEGAPTDRFEVYDTRSGQWRSLESLPAPLTGHSMAALNNRLYVFGDKSSNARTVDSYEYNVATDRWRPIAQMPTPRNLTAAAALNDKIYVVGGYDDGREFATCEYYLPAANRWGQCAPMLIPRGSPGLARVGQSLFAVGGGWSGFVGFNERYDPDNDRWTPFETPLVGDWRNTAVASLPTEFYVFGGNSNGRRLPLNYVYEVFTNRTYLPAFQSGDR